MAHPNLQLRHYFFPLVLVRANIDYRPQEDSAIAGNFEITSSVMVNKENDCDFQLQVDIKSAPKEGQSFSHEIELSVVGYFLVNQEFKEKQKLVQITGASILYSAAREFLMAITSRGPWPPVMLPTFTFIPDAESEDAPKKQAKRTKKTVQQ